MFLSKIMRYLLYFSCLECQHSREYLRFMQPFHKMSHKDLIFSLIYHCKDFEYHAKLIKDAASQFQSVHAIQIIQLSSLAINNFY